MGEKEGRREGGKEEEGEEKEKDIKKWEEEIGKWLKPHSKTK